MEKAGKNENNLVDCFSKIIPFTKERKMLTVCGDTVETSVDLSFTDKETGTKYYIEVDSYNMAKVVLGQYILLNQTKLKMENCVFVVIHFYKGYNPARTKAYLKFAQVKYGCTICASVFHVDAMRKIKNQKDFVDLINANIIK